MGGYIALLVAAFHPMIKAVVAWATPFCFEGLRESLAAHSSPQLKEDFYQDERLYNAARFVPKVKNLMLIHGAGDETVPLAHAEKLYRSAQEPKELQVVEGADHTFSNPLLRQKAMSYSLTWFTHYLTPLISSSPQD